MSSRDDRAKIKRGSQPRRRIPPAPRAKAKKAAPSSTSRALALVPTPVKVATMRAAKIGLVVGAIGLVVVGLFAIRLPQMVGIELGEMVGRAGFAVKRIEIKGIDRMDRKPIEDAALDQQDLAMPLVDVGAIREKLLQQGWVADARVTRRLPDTLVVDIVERQPAAIWQNRGKLALIDADGRIIEQVRLEGSPLPDVPIVIGPGANFQIAALNQLMGASPALKPMLDGATWIGDRRWDIRFRSGETLSLPEGDREARVALQDFTKRDLAVRLLGRGIIRFDMRIPGKMVVRKPAALPPAIDDAPVAEAAPAAPPKQERVPAPAAAPATAPAAKAVDRETT